jgi:hypothetical protein
MALFDKINKAVGNLANWLGIGSLLGGGTVLAALMAWAASTWDAISSQGIGAVIFAGVAGACLIVLTLSAAAVAWRWLKPLPATPNIFSPDFPVLDFGQDKPENHHEILRATRDSIGAIVSVLDENDPVQKVARALETATAQIQVVADALKGDNLTILQLLDFSSQQASVVMLGELIWLAPPERPDAELNDETREKDLEYVRVVRSHLGGSFWGQNLTNVLAMAEHRAEQLIEETPIEERNPADPIRYRRWAIAQLQVVSTVAFLERCKRQATDSIIGCRAQLFEQLARRNKT